MRCRAEGTHVQLAAVDLVNIDVGCVVQTDKCPYLVDSHVCLAVLTSMPVAMLYLSRACMLYIVLSRAHCVQLHRLFLLSYWLGSDDHHTS